MFIAWGEKFYGYVDYVNDVCYVVTKFFYLQYLPLVPLQSFVVIAGSEDGEGFKGVPIPMSAKSVIAGYTRMPLALATMIFFGMSTWRMAEAMSPGLGWFICIPAVIAAACACGLWNALGNVMSGLLMVGSLVGLGICMAKKTPGVTSITLLAITCFFLYSLTRLWNKANHYRAEELLAHLGLSRKQSAELLGNSPGRPSATEE